MNDVTVKTSNNSGDQFSDFYAVKRGEKCWNVFGRNSEKYGVKPDGKGRYVMLVAHPNKGRKLAGVPGWPTKREAEQVARRIGK
jgi:hypothetical protein